MFLASCARSSADRAVASGATAWCRKTGHNPFRRDFHRLTMSAHRPSPPLSDGDVVATVVARLTHTSTTTDADIALWRRRQETR